MVGSQTRTWFLQVVESGSVGFQLWAGVGPARMAGDLGQPSTSQLQLKVVRLL
jgi:hypothetical protein